MVKPSDHDYRYLLDGANDLLRAIHEERVSDALQIGCGLFARLEEDLKKPSRLRQAIDDAGHSLQQQSRDAISCALEVFATVELTAFRRAGAIPVLVEEMSNHADWARIFVERPILDIELVRKKVSDLREAVCSTKKSLEDKKQLDRLLDKSKEAAVGGAFLYVNTAADLLGGSGVFSVLSVGVGVGVIGRALGIPGLKWPGSRDSGS